MRPLLLACVLIAGLTGCYRSHTTDERALPSETAFLHAARDPDGVLRVVRVDARGQVEPHGPPLAQAQPPVTDVVRMLRSADARRVVVTDRETGSQALRDGRWAAVCPAESCTATSGSADLELVVVAYPDTARWALVHYDGRRIVDLVDADVRFAPSGWAVGHGESGFEVVSDEGLVTLERLPDETLGAVIEGGFITFEERADGSLGPGVWARDRRTGARTPLACPDDGSRFFNAFNRLRWSPCGDRIYGTELDGPVATGHAYDPDTQDSVKHIESGAYTLLFNELRPEIGIQLRAPDGAMLAARLPGAPDGAVGYRALRLGERTERDRYAAYLMFTYEDDAGNHREDGLFVWQRGAGAQWHPIDREDTAAAPLWFPGQRVFWVSWQGQLRSYDFGTGIRADHGAGYTFVGAY